MGANHGKNRGKQPRTEFMPRDAKQPHVAVGTGSKSPRTAVPPGNAEDTVVWQFRHIDVLLADWKQHADLGDVHQLVGRLQHLEQLGWSGIARLKHRPGGDHLIPPSSLCKAAQDRLEKLQLDDHEELLSIRVTRKKRAWAVRVGTTSIARMLWWDPEHKVCPVEKKNT